MLFSDDISFDESPEKDLLISSCSLPSSRLDLFRKPTTFESSKASANSAQSNIGQRNNANVTESRNSGTKRKFPGPAGLLPDKPPRSFNDSSLLMECTEENRSPEESILCSQTFLSVFEDPPYKRLQQDFEIDKSDSPLRTVTIQWVKKRHLKGRKIPFLALVLESVDCSHIDPVLTLRDPSGALHGVISSDLWKEIGPELKIGSAIVLKEVGIINNAASSFMCLNITKSNIVIIYTPENDGEVCVSTKQTANSADLARHVADWQAKASNLQCTTPIRNPLMFIQERNSSSDLFKIRSIPGDTPPHRRAPGDSAPTTPLGRQSFRPYEKPPTETGRKPRTNETSANFNLFANDDDDDFDLASVEEKLQSPFCAPAPQVQNNVFPSSPVRATQHEALNTSMLLTQDEANMVNEVLADLEFDDFN